MTTPYYSPENYGLKTVGEISWSEPCYDFDLTVVWQGDDGRLYYADDSGCSCPSPFEDIRDMGDLTPVTYPELRTHLDGRVDDYSRSQVANLLKLVREVAS